MQTKYLIIPLLFFYLACGSEIENRSKIAGIDTKIEVKFDKTKWRLKKGSDYPYREQMLNYIVYDKKVRVLKKEGLLKLLGQPDRSKNGHLYYRIAQKRLWLWPLHTKTLVIKISENNTIEWIKIHN